MGVVSRNEWSYVFLVFVLPLFVHALFLEWQWRGWDDDDLLCKIGSVCRANGDAELFAYPCFSSAPST